METYNEYKKMLNESSDKLMRFLNKHMDDGCIIASAEKITMKTNAEKKEAFKDLCKYVHDAGYSYIPVSGMYTYMEDDASLGVKKGDVGHELSIIIPIKKRNGEEDSNDMEELAKRICEVFEQQTVVICYKNMCWFENKDGKTKADFSGVKLADAMSEFWTKMKGGSVEFTGMRTFESICVPTTPNLPLGYSKAFAGKGEIRPAEYHDYDILNDRYDENDTLMEFLGYSPLCE